MNIILLSDDSEVRLWPLSTDTRLKQFLKPLQDENGRSKLMIQRACHQLLNAKLEANHILMATVTTQ